jgi:3-methyl-2-oxobutanoate hydroxymethyltransferase
MSIYRDRPARTVRDLAHMKRAGEKIACLTAYDASFAALLDRCGVELLLVGDSLGMVIQGRDTTLAADMDAMVYHCRAVAHGRSRAFLVADMPFMSYPNPDAALNNAGRLLREGGVQMVKLEAVTGQSDIVRALSDHGIPVCAHLGLMPQSIHKLGGYFRQGETDVMARRMRAQALELEAAGADLLLLECVPWGLAAEISAELEIPVIGIGSGAACDGQILVVYDILGLSERRPRFARDFLAGRDSLAQAIEAYVESVKSGSFPDSDSAG